MTTKKGVAADGAAKKDEQYQNTGSDKAQGGDQSQDDGDDEQDQDDARQAKNQVKIGHILLYYPNGKDNEAAISGRERTPAIVTHVEEDKSVNLRVFQDGQSIPLSRKSVLIGRIDDAPYCLPM